MSRETYQLHESRDVGEEVEQKDLLRSSLPYGLLFSRGDFDKGV